jgi:hypothetical protein
MALCGGEEDYILRSTGRGRAGASNTTGNWCELSGNRGRVSLSVVARRSASYHSSTATCPPSLHLDFC